MQLPEHLDHRAGLRRPAPPARRCAAGRRTPSATGAAAAARRPAAGSPRGARRPAVRPSPAGRSSGTAPGRWTGTARAAAPRGRCAPARAVSADTRSGASAGAGPQPARAPAASSPASRSTTCGVLRTPATVARDGAVRRAPRGSARSGSRTEGSTRAPRPDRCRPLHDRDPPTAQVTTWRDLPGLWSRHPSAPDRVTDCTARGGDAMRNLRRQGVVALGLAGLLVGTAACGSDDSGSSGADEGAQGGEGGTLVFGASADPVSLDARLRQRRRVAARRPADLRDPRDHRGGRHRDRAGPRQRVGGRRGRHRLDLHAARGRHVPRRHRLQRRGGLLQLRPLVQLQGRPAERVGLLLLADRLQRLRQQRDSEHLGESLYAVLRGDRRDHGRHQPDRRRPPSFLTGLALASFSIASPTALEEFEADKVTGTGEEPRFEGTFGTEHPSAPARTSSRPSSRATASCSRATRTTGATRPSIETVIFRPIADGPARRQALRGRRDPGLRPGRPGRRRRASRAPASRSCRAPGVQRRLRRLQHRQAAARQPEDPPGRSPTRSTARRSSRRKYPEGSEVATQFMPPELFGYADDVPEYEYDVEKAKALIAESGVANPTIEFWYPTDVSRPYMPDPAANFQAFQADLAGGRLHGRRRSRRRGTRTTSTRSTPARPACACSAGPATSVTRTTSSGRSSAPSSRPGARSRRSIYTDLEAARAETDQDARTDALRGRQQEDHGVPPGCARTSTPSRAWRSPRASRATSPAR